MVSIIPERQLTLAENLALIGTIDALMELTGESVEVGGDPSSGFIITSEDGETQGTLNANLSDRPHPLFGYSTDGISLSATTLSESFGLGNILIEPSIQKTGSVEIWADIAKKSNLRTSRPVVLITNGENSELIKHIAEALDHPDYLKIADTLSIHELLALAHNCSVGVTSTPGGLLLVLGAMTPFLHVYSTTSEKQIIDDMELSSFGFGYQMLDKGQSPAVITAKLKDVLEDEIFLRKEIERFRVFMRPQFLGVLGKLLA